MVKMSPAFGAVRDGLSNSRFGGALPALEAIGDKPLLAPINRALIPGVPGANAVDEILTPIALYQRLLDRASLATGQAGDSHRP